MVEATTNQNRKVEVNWDVCLPIKEELKADQPFDQFPSKHVTAHVLSFVGYKHEVCQTLQELSHQSRAYIIAQSGLTGFLRPGFMVWFNYNCNKVEGPLAYLQD